MSSPILPSSPPQLDVFPNFKEHPSLLTLHEMVEIQNGCLLPVLEGVHSSFSQHIMKDCQVQSHQLCPLQHFYFQELSALVVLRLTVIKYLFSLHMIAH